MKEIVLEKVCRSYRVPIKGNSFLEYLFRRKYKQIEAVQDISFEISAGETVGLVGPNGAGKSTTIKMLTGVLTDTGSGLSGKSEKIRGHPWRAGFPETAGAAAESGPADESGNSGSPSACAEDPLSG